MCASDGFSTDQIGYLKELVHFLKINFFLIKMVMYERFDRNQHVKDGGPQSKVAAQNGCFKESWLSNHVILVDRSE